MSDQVKPPPTCDVRKLIVRHTTMVMEEAAASARAFMLANAVSGV